MQARREQPYSIGRVLAIFGILRLGGRPKKRRLISLVGQPYSIGLSNMLHRVCGEPLRCFLAKLPKRFWNMSESLGGAPRYAWLPRPYCGSRIRSRSILQQSSLSYAKAQRMRLRNYSQILELLRISATNRPLNSLTRRAHKLASRAAGKVPKLPDRDDLPARSRARQGLPKACLPKLVPSGRVVRRHRAHVPAWECLAN